MEVGCRKLTCCLSLFDLQRHSVRPGAFVTFDRHPIHAVQRIRATGIRPSNDTKVILELLAIGSEPLTEILGARGLTALVIWPL